MYTKKYIKALLKRLEKTNQAWCFDGWGRIWTRETASLYLLSPEAWGNRS